MADGLDAARDAFAQEIPAPERPRDQSGRFVSQNKPEPIFEGRPFEGEFNPADDTPDEQESERRSADGWDQTRNEDSRRRNVPDDATRARHAAANQGDDQAADDQQGEPQKDAHQHDKDAEGSDEEHADEAKGRDAEGQPVEDTGPKYKINIDGQEQEVSLTEALKGYQREATFNARMGQMVEVAKAIDARGQEATMARDTYINMCRTQEQEFAALIPQEPSQAQWDQLYKDSPQQAHALESNYKAVYGTLNGMRQRREAAEREAFQDNQRRTADYARAEFIKFSQRNKLANQTEIDKAIGAMRRTALSHGFTEDEIGTTYDERMMSILYKASKYDNMVANKPFPVQPERGGALKPGSAPRVGNGVERTMNDAQRRLAASGRMEDAANVMFQLLRR